MKTLPKFSIYKLPLNVFIARYMEGDEEVNCTEIVESYPAAKECIKNHLQKLLTELEPIKMKDIL